MGEVLAHKRQTVVDRLRRRFDHYRKHHNACLPRYEQSADSLFEKHRQETLMLKQRYLESKAKKAKTGKNSNSNEHHKHAIVRETLSDTQKLLSHPKAVKRPRGHSPVIPMPPEVSSDDLECYTKTAKPCNYESNLSSEHHYKKPSSSTLLAQQKKLPSNCHNSKVKTQQFSPKANNVKILDNCAGPPVEGKDLINPSHPDGIASLPLKRQSKTSIIPNTHSEKITESCNLVSKAAECKQEKDQKNDSTLCQFQEDSINYSESLQHNQDRLSDTFPSIGGLAEDSCDDVLHPDILKDLFDDVFTNSPDMMDFFGDSVGSIKVGDEDDPNKNNALMKSSQYQSAVDKLTFSINDEVESEQPSGLFTNSLTTVSTALASTKSVFSTMPSASESASKVYIHSGQQCLPLYNSLSTSHQLPDSLSIDFKLTEPSPAALTLKQMAEQHQNMQQKQQLGRSLESSNRMAFRVNPFSDPVSVSFRNRFFINDGNNSVSKSSNSSISLFNSAALASERKYPEIEPLTGFKEESCPERQLDSPQRPLLMRPSSHAEQKSPCIASTRLGWAVDSTDHPNAAAHPIDSQYLTVNNKPQVNENRMLGIGFDTRTVQQVKVTNSDMMQQEEVVQQPYSNVYNIYTPQHSNSGISNSMFSAAVPLPHNISYNTHFTSTVGPLPPEYKLDQPNTVSLVEQTTVQTPATYQQTYIRQQAHNQSMNNQWRHVQLPQNSLNIENYEINDGYRQLPSHDNQVTATTIHHTVNYPYSSANGHGQVTRPNFPVLINQPVMQHCQQLNPQFHQRQQLSVEHRLLSAMSGQTLGTETTSHISASVYNIAQDNNHINLDFLENIHSNASDLLSFDQMLHSETETTFQLMG